MTSQPSAGRLAGQVALITGGSSGIGLATAQRFVAEGAYVFITGRRQALLDQAVVTLGGAKHATAVAGDVLNLSDIDRLMETIEASKGQLDVLVANAGGPTMAPIAAVTEAQYDEQFDVNTKSMFFTVQKALPVLKDGASVVLISSIAGQVGGVGTSVYCAAKAAVRSFARSMTAELKSRRIRVNAISPGATDTDSMPPQMRTYLITTIPKIPMGRFARADEIASAILFLASSDSSYITGIDLVVDGGTTQV